MLLDKNDNNKEFFDEFSKYDKYDQPESDDTIISPVKTKDEHNIFKELLSYLKIMCVAIVLALIINNFIIINATVPTGSMNNTIMENDRLIGFRLSYLFSKPERGDIIIFKYPDNPSEKFVKRIIGVPGDIVEIKKITNGSDSYVRVYVNGEELYEPYIKEPMQISHDYLYIVPADSYFVMGDNRNDSKDSRYWINTYVPEDYILAKAIFKYYREVEFLNTKYN